MESYKGMHAIAREILSGLEALKTSGNPDEKSVCNDLMFLVYAHMVYVFHVIIPSYSIANVHTHTQYMNFVYIHAYMH